MAAHVEDLRDPESVPDELLCSICTGLFLDPHACLCGHCFCGFCISHWLRHSRCCPLCRRDVQLSQLRERRDLREECDAMETICPWRCGWHGRRDEQGRHSTECPLGWAGDVTVRVDGMLGIWFEILDGILLVGSLHEDGAAWKYNQLHYGRAEAQIRVNDQVVQIDGIRGEPAMLAYLARRTGRKSIMLRRPQELAVSIDKQGRKLGMDISWSRRSGVLTVLSVAEGAVLEYNSSTRSLTEQIQKNDRIIEVNGVNGVGRPESVVPILIESSTCVIKFHRPRHSCVYSL